MHIASHTYTCLVFNHKHVFRLGWKTWALQIFVPLLLMSEVHFRCAGEAKPGQTWHRFYLPPLVVFLSHASILSFFHCCLWRAADGSHNCSGRFIFICGAGERSLSVLRRCDWLLLHVWKRRRSRILVLAQITESASNHCCLKMWLAKRISCVLFITVNAVYY